MRDLWFTADTHFNHAGMLKFKRADDTYVRPDFRDLNHMNEVLTHNWNKAVRAQDKVYHLGDVVMGPKGAYAKILSRLAGHKRLVLGNHDDPKLLAPFFEKIVLWRNFKEWDFICSHVPLREDTFRKVNFNVHGHIHQNTEPTIRHACVSVEQTGYAPVHLDEIRAILKRRDVPDTREVKP